MYDPALSKHTHDIGEYSSTIIDNQKNTIYFLLFPKFTNSILLSKHCLV